MSSQHARKRKSDQMNEPTTPTGSPSKRMRITQTQKQALIDNLQLEVTERARQLRAHYALQCSDLRARIERRINRVPTGVRKMKMGELIAQHLASQSNTNPSPTQSIPIIRSPSKQQLDDRPLPALPSPSKLPSPVRQPIMLPQKSRKRKSSAIRIPSDKENHEPDTSTTALDSLPVQKNTKRTKTAHQAATVAPAPPKRTASRTQKKPLKASAIPEGVLSPRSHNSRTLPRSPIKDKELLPPVPVREASPLRQQQSPTRPLSPSKSQSPFKAAMSGISAFAKRGYAAAGAKLTRPLSREKEQYTLTGMGTTIPGSPTGRMLPPARPALATLTSAGVTSIPTISPQRTTSQASMRSNASEQSIASTNNTVVKSGRVTGLKKAATLSRTITSKKVTTTVATKTKGKIVVSGSTASTVSPKAGIKRPPTTTAAAAKKSAMPAAVTKKTATVAPVPTGRVLRKRN